MPTEKWQEVNGSGERSLISTPVLPIVTRDAKLVKIFQVTNARPHSAHGCHANSAITAHFAFKPPPCGLDWLCVNYKLSDYPGDKH